MKTFEMPKMNVAIFSLEDVITTSGGEVTPAVKNLDAAKEALAAAGVGEANITATTASDWINA